MPGMEQREGHCGCCGIPLDGQRAFLRRCMVCDRCDHKHGDELQIAIEHLLANGKIESGQAMVRMLIDDAHLSGRIVWIVDPDTSTAMITIPDPPQRWEVVCARAMVRGSMPDLQSVIEAVLTSYIGKQSAPSVLRNLEGDLSRAMAFVDPDVLSVSVEAHRDAIDPGHLFITVSTRTACMPGVVSRSDDADALIPDDIALRPRAQA